MRRSSTIPILGLAILLGIRAGGAVAVEESARRPVRGEILLAPREGPAGVSAQIAAQARYLAMVGHQIEPPGAAARAGGDSQDVLRWAATYFGRREVDRAWRADAPTIHAPDEAARRELLERRVRNFLQEALKGDLTAELNWLLHELAAMTLPYEYLTRDGAGLPPALDVPLDAHDIHHIQLTDGGRDKGRLLAFRADSAKILETPWPRALRGSNFAPPCKEFERLRDEVLSARTQGRRNPKAEQRLMAACDALCAQFTEAYPREVRIQSCKTYTEYLAGKRFLQALAAGVLRVVMTEDAWVFDGTYRFEGDNLIELIGHMCRHGLEFAPAAPGGEGTYRTLFENMRRIYLHLGADNPQRDFERP